MKLHKRCLFSIALAGVTVTGAMAQKPQPSSEQSTSYFVRPDIGQVAHAEVGASLYSEGYLTETRLYTGTLKESASVQMQGYHLNVASSTSGPISVKYGSSKPMMCFPMTRGAVGALFGRAPYYGCLVDTKGTKIFDAAVFFHRNEEYALDHPVPYSVAAKDARKVEHDSFQVDVLYQGMSKGEVKISYRESSGGVARPAFTQDVSYELEADGTAIIGFKGMRLKVLRASGQSLEYVLEKPIPSAANTRFEHKAKTEQKLNKPWYQ